MRNPVWAPSAVRASVRHYVMASMTNAEYMAAYRTGESYCRVPRRAVAS